MIELSFFVASASTDSGNMENKEGTTPSWGNTDPTIQIDTNRHQPSINSLGEEKYVYGIRRNSPSKWVTADDPSSTDHQKQKRSATGHQISGMKSSVIQQQDEAPYAKPTREISEPCDMPESLAQSSSDNEEEDQDQNSRKHNDQAGLKDTCIEQRPQVWPTLDHDTSAPSVERSNCDPRIYEANESVSSDQEHDPAKYRNGRTGPGTLREGIEHERSANGKSTGSVARCNDIDNGGIDNLSSAMTTRSYKSRDRTTRVSAQ